MKTMLSDKTAVVWVFQKLMGCRKKHPLPNSPVTIYNFTVVLVANIKKSVL